MNITNTVLVRSLLAGEVAATYQTVQVCYREMAARLGHKTSKLSDERAWLVCQRVMEIRRKHSPKSIPTVVEILRGQTDRRGPKPAGHNETGNQMKNDKTVRVTLRRKAADCTGKPYEVMKFVNAVVVTLSDPVIHDRKKLEVRVGDFLSEENATVLMDSAEVTVV